MKQHYHSRWWQHWVIFPSFYNYSVYLNPSVCSESWRMRARMMWSYGKLLEMPSAIQKRWSDEYVYTYLCAALHIVQNLSTSQFFCTHIQKTLHELLISTQLPMAGWRESAKEREGHSAAQNWVSNTHGCVFPRVSTSTLPIKLINMTTWVNQSCKNWSLPVLNRYHLFYIPFGFYNEEYTFFDTRDVWYFLRISLFLIPFGSIYYARTFIPL